MLQNKAIAQTCPPNIDFETGTFDGWTCSTGFAEAIGGQNITNLVPGAPQPGRHTLFSINTDTGLDPYGNFPVVCPNGSGYSIMLGNNMGGHEADGISYEFTIPAGQNTYHLVYHYAVVFHEPNHQAHEQPRMEIELLNVSDNSIIPCASFTFIAIGSSLPGFQESANSPDNNPVLFKDWTAVSVDLSGNAGKTIRLSFKTTDCTFNRHFGYAYIDINTECDGKITGAEFCPTDTAVNVVAPYGFESYTWYNEAKTSVLGNGQILTLRPPPAPNTILAVRLTPYPGYGCEQTLLVKLNNTLSVNAIAGRDTLSCNLQAIRLGTTPIPGLVYNWSPAAGLSNPFTSNPFAAPDIPTTYFLSVRSSGGGCVSLDTVVVNASQLNNALTVIGKEMICLGTGDSALLTVEPTDNISWYKNNELIPGASKPAYLAITTGIYHAFLKNLDGCALSTPQKAINISTKPSADFGLNKAAQCLTGNRFVLTNNSTNDVGVMQYQWLPGDGSRSEAQHLDHRYPRAGKYEVKLIVSSNPECADTAFTNIEVYQNAVADFSTKNICRNLPLEITNNTLDTMASPVHYKWTFGNGETSDLRDPEDPVFTRAGNYNISLAVHTDQCPTPLNLLTQRVVVEQEQPGIAYPVKYALINTPLRLQARNIGQSAIWMPALHLNNNNSFTPIFKSNVEQLYTIKLTTESGCITTDTQLVKTIKEVFIAVPTAFTPNNDGRNDVLRPTVFGIKELRHFRVFNRWGQIVFTTSTEGKGWDGNVNGAPQATQTYVWVAEVLGGDDKLHVAKGTSVLIR